MFVPPGAKSMMNRLSITYAAASLSRSLEVRPINSLNWEVGPCPPRIWSCTSSALASMSFGVGCTFMPSGILYPITMSLTGALEEFATPLSPRCCADLGIPLSEEDRQRPYVEVSGRKGLGVKADDLMDSLISKALEEVSSRHPDDAAGRNLRVATQIAIAALRYFLLKFTRNTVIAFDLQEALSFEGETGPYVQYSAVRARNILRKLEERGETIPDFSRELDTAAMARQLEKSGIVS